MKMVETLDWRQIEMVADQLDRRAAPTRIRAQQPKPPRQRRARSAPPDGLRTMAEAAARLSCSVKTLKGYVDAGALRYVIIGHGTKRPRKMFTDADLDAFIEAQTRKDVPHVHLPKPRVAVLAIRLPVARSSVLWLDETHDAAGSRESRGGRAREGATAGRATGGGQDFAAARRRSRAATGRRSGSITPAPTAPSISSRC